ncbi:MAG: hypothetical protein ACI9VR_000454 [Cognaticolwellia sp.]|jgi:hypothetical protein
MSLPPDQPQPVPLLASPLATPLITPLGRSLVIEELNEHEERLEVRDAQGVLEMEVRLTRDGPVLRLSSERIELNATDTVAVNCERFVVNAKQSVQILSEGDAKVQAKGALDLQATGELRLRSEDELKAVANMIWLN